MGIVSPLIVLNMEFIKITEQFHKFGSTCHYYFRHYYPIKDKVWCIVSLNCLTVGLKVGGEGLKIT